jgi:hypothetical protein
MGISASFPQSSGADSSASNAHLSTVGFAFKALMPAVEQPSDTQRPPYRNCTRRYSQHHASPPSLPEHLIAMLETLDRGTLQGLRDSALLLDHRKVKEQKAGFVGVTLLQAA